MNAPDPRPPANEPEPNTPLAEVTAHLRRLEPTEPDSASRDRAWQRISTVVAQSERAAAFARLKGLAPAEADPAANTRVWDRVRAALPVEKRLAAVPAVPVQRTRGRARLWASRPAWVVAALVLVVTLTTVNSVAQAALPGSTLYPVKRAWEDLRWALMVAPTRRAELALALAGRRGAEAESLVAQGSNPALVADTLEDAVANLEYAADYLPAEVVASQADLLLAAASDWPAAYASAAAALVDELGDLPLPTATLAPPPVATATAASMTPPSSVTPRPPTLTPTTTPMPTSTGTGTSILPLPTVQLPTVVLPPLLPTATPTPVPTSGLSQTPAPTATPILPLPTLPLPTLPPLLPSATPGPSPTPIIVLPTLPLPLPTLPLPLP